MLNTMVMSVYERIREIGTLRAIGWRKIRVMRMILVESLLLSLAGGMVGSMAAVCLTHVLSHLRQTAGFIQGDVVPVDRRRRLSAGRSRSASAERSIRPTARRRSQRCGEVSGSEPGTAKCFCRCGFRRYFPLHSSVTRVYCSAALTAARKSGTFPWPSGG